MIRCQTCLPTRPTRTSCLGSTETDTCTLTGGFLLKLEFPVTCITFAQGVSVFMTVCLFVHFSVILLQSYDLYLLWSLIGL